MQFSDIILTQPLIEEQEVYAATRHGFVDSGCNGILCLISQQADSEQGEANNM